MDYSMFQDFGLAGVVIAALFFLIRWFLEDMKAVRNEHKSERDEWRESDIKRHAETNETILHFSKTNQSLAEAINRQADRHRDGDR